MYNTTELCALTFLVREIFPKISRFFPCSRVIASDNYTSESQNNEAVRPFEPQSGETLVERPHYSAGNTVKQSDAVTMTCLTAAV